jgi:hypothetical protein
MSMICHNPQCRDHTPLPGGLPESVRYVMVQDGLEAPEPVEPYYPGRCFGVPPKSVAKRVVERHPYVSSPGKRWPEAWLCGPCHAALEVKS